MLHERRCLNCGTELTGRIDQHYCTDKCRKYFKRHGGVGLSGLNLALRADTIAEKADQGRTSSKNGNSSVTNHLLKTAINLASKVAENRLIPPRFNSGSVGVAKNSNIPLQIQTPDNNLAFLFSHFNRAKLTSGFDEFLGELSYPFKMLVYGMPGNGKSTFCMQLANEIANNFRILYVSGEELLSSATLMNKQNRTILPQNHSKCSFINRLPNSESEWRSILIDKAAFSPINVKAIFYDSVTKLDITPFYVDAIANDCKLPDFGKQVSHIFITHAHKDGSTYRGDGSWGHEVDIIIRCDNGIAITEKNRFGQEGKELKIFDC